VIRVPLIIAAGVAAAAAAMTPAIAGLNGNPSFSEHLPVRLPSHARAVQFSSTGPSGAGRAEPLAVRSSAVRAAEPGDDSPRSRSHAASESRETEPGDDRGRNGGGSRGGHDG
jgi:hypothetical protein